MSTPEQRNGAEKITVSRDALRADLLDTELRLRGYLDTKLELKASQVQVDSLLKRMDALDRGELPVGLMLQITTTIDRYVKAAQSSVWSLRANKVSSLAWVIALVAVAVSITTVFYGG